MRLSSVFISLFALCSVLALPLVQPESDSISLASRFDNDCESDGVCLLRRAKSAAAKARTAAKAATRKTAKADRAKANKAAGAEAQKSKTKSQVAADRKARKKTKATTKEAKATKAKAKPGYKSHDQKTKDNKAKITFSTGAAKRLDGMKLHGKDRKKAKKYHKDVLKNEMKNNPALKDAKKANVVATSHKGGTVKDEKNHITAQFTDSKNRQIPSSWVDKKTGETKTGEKDQHHVYPSEKKKVPTGWSNAVKASEAKQAAASAADKAAADAARNEKVTADKEAGAAKQSTISAADKTAQREAKKAEKEAKKAAAIAKKGGAAPP